MKREILLKHRGSWRYSRLPAVLLTLLLCCAASAVQAQISITGKVTDEAGTGMPGVNVLVKGTTIGTTTDVDGNYSLRAPETTDGVLVFSFIGYETIEHPLNGRTVVNASLAPSVESLGEVVVIGYGTQRKRDVTGSIVSVTSETLQEVPAPNFVNQLKGRAAGVTIVSNGSTPGADGQIRIRGKRSLAAPVTQNTGGGGGGANAAASATNEDNLDAPLLVVDGIPYGGSINDINPDDIASLEVLKDASATAIYGSRGSGGVILISTKRGKAGKTVFSYDGYYGVSKVMDKLRVFTGPELAQFKLDAAAGSPSGTTSYGLTAAETAALNAGISTDWQDLIYKKGYFSSHNISASGGTDKTQFSMGLTYFKEAGIIPNQDFERFAIRGTLDNQVSDRIKIGLNTINTLSYINTPGGGGVPGGLMRMTPLASPYNADGSVNLRPQEGHIDAASVSPLTLLSRADAILAKTRRLRTFNSLYAEVQIVKDLKYRLNVGLDYTQTQQDSYSGANTYVNNSELTSQSNANVRNSEFFQYTLEHLLIYDKTIHEKHRIGLTGMFSAQKDHQQGSGIFGVGIPADYVQSYNIGLAISDQARNPSNSFDNPFTFTERGLVSYMGRVTYGYDGRYNLTATIRKDGSSVLAPGNKWFTYPAFALAWNISEESFMQNVAFVNTLKLRGGWGKTSNQSLPAYSTLGGLNAKAYNFGKTSLGNQSGYLVTTLPNDKLSWQSTTQINFGLDFSVLKSRITGSVDVYSMKTKDILLGVQLPYSNGATETVENVGKTKGSGLEIMLSGDIFKKADGGFTWSVDVNYFFNREEIVALTTPNEKQNINNGWFVGEPISVIYDVKKIGIWQPEDADELAAQTSPQQRVGQIRVEDRDNNGIINSEDRQIIGNFQPDWEGGLTNRFSFKNFDLSVVMYARMGMKVVVPYVTSDGGFGGYFSFMQGRVNQLKVDYWTPENHTNAFPQPDASRDRPLWSSTLGYMDGSFIKCRSINFGYTLPSSLISKAGVSSLRVYVSAVNPFVLYSPFVDDGFGPDPEGNGYGGSAQNQDAGYTNNNSGSPLRAITVNANNPSTRQFLVGMNLRF
jgi:TonB-linked SusC/RagA family outer membrane protein